MMTKHITKLLIFFIIISFSFGSNIYKIRLSHGVLIYEPADYQYKHVNPRTIEVDEIPLGETLSYSYALNSTLTYHIYLSGPWIENIQEENRTDYDIYVYNPYGELEAWHTEAAALPEHLGTTIHDAFFQPRYDGNYTFQIRNDESESLGAQEATLMVIEHLDTNKWYRDKLKMQGKDTSGQPTYLTTWAYEFTTNEPRIEVLAVIPETLDMYEVRLFFMADPDAGTGNKLSGAPIPTNSYLYGYYPRNDPRSFGGYNLDSKGFRGAAFGSCEYFGQNMSITLNPGSSESDKLFHIVFIAEKGWGLIDFLIKTDFEPPSLSMIDPFSESTVDEDTMIMIGVEEEGSGIEDVILNYSIDSWDSFEIVSMSESVDGEYIGFIPSHLAGTVVEWRAIARDHAWNIASLEGNFTVKGLSSISVTTTSQEYIGDDPVVISGYIFPVLPEENITLCYIKGETEIISKVKTNSDGEFDDEFHPDVAGTWQLVANWSGGDVYYNSEYRTEFTVRKSRSYLSIYETSDVKKVGKEITILGDLTPELGGEIITFTFTDPKGGVLEEETTTSVIGTLSKEFIPEKAGTHEVTATWEGNGLFESITSNTVTIDVKGTIRLDSNMTMIVVGIVVVSVVVLSGLYYILRRRAGSKEEEEGHYYFE